MASTSLIKIISNYTTIKWDNHLTCEQSFPLYFKHIHHPQNSSKFPTQRPRALHSSLRATLDDRRCGGWCSNKSVVMWGNYPLVMADIAIENDHRNSGFSHWKWWFSIVMLVYQRVCSHCIPLHHIATLTSRPENFGLSEGPFQFALLLCPSINVPARIHALHG